jgi:hypothetical protein
MCFVILSVEVSSNAISILAGDDGGVSRINYS